MKRYEITISKVMHRMIDEFNTEEEARAYAISNRDRYRELIDDNKVEYFYELTEVSDV
jgi:predicted HAD superfamily Cof-like phosphohydrolase